MRFRAAHLACVMVLLSTLGAAETHALARGNDARGGQRIGILLQQAAIAAPENAFPRAAASAPQAALPGSPVAHTRPAWTMRPPAAHSLAQHAVTGSGL